MGGEGNERKQKRRDGKEKNEMRTEANGIDQGGKKEKRNRRGEGEAKQRKKGGEDQGKVQS